MDDEINQLEQEHRDNLIEITRNYEDRIRDEKERFKEVMRDFMLQRRKRKPNLDGIEPPVATTSWGVRVKYNGYSWATSPIIKDDDEDM